jgi:hypothetical protein
MDMLATWITLRSNGHNPSATQYGYKTQPAASPQLRKLANIETTLANTVSIVANMYCDDVQFTTNSFNDMQDLVGIIQEFMTTFGIPINASKSFYTAYLPDPTKTNKATLPITTAPNIAGKWEGDATTGKWICDNAHPTYLSIKQPDEAIRYLGVHFAMDGSWKHQADLLVKALDTSLSRIRTRGLPPEQLVYLINTVIIPKLTFPLNERVHHTLGRILQTSQKYGLDDSRICRRLP